MKKETEKRISAEDILFRNRQRRMKRAVKMVSLVMAASFTVVSSIIVPIGHASDICLQVPSEQTLAMVVGQTPNRAGSGVVFTDAQGDLNMSSLEKDTFVISEQTDRDGISVELLDVSAFEPKDETMFVFVQTLAVRSEPDADAEVVGTIVLGDPVTRTGEGSSWSQIEFVAENETVVRGYVLSDKLTSEAVATPTPVPTETPTPTPTPKPKAEKTPTPTPEPTPTPKPVSEETSKPEPTPTPEPTISKTAESGTYYSAGEVNVRSGPDTTYSVQRKLSRNESVEVVALTDNGWFELSDGGFVKASLVSDEKFVDEEETETTTTRPQTSETETPSESSDEPSEGSQSRGTPDIPSPDSCDLLTYARAFVGVVPYVYGGANLDGMDCSGFLMYVYARYYGISLPHQSASIAEMGEDVTSEERKPGDIFCHDYNGDGRVDHVSLYCGNGVVIHASTSNGCIIEDYVPMMAVVTVRRLI